MILRNLREGKGLFQEYAKVQDTLIRRCFFPCNWNFGRGETICCEIQRELFIFRPVLESGCVSP